MHRASKVYQYRIRRLSQGNLSPYMVFSFLIHVGVALFLLQSLLRMEIPKPKDATVIRLVDLSRPESKQGRAVQKTTPRQKPPVKASPPSPPALSEPPDQPRDIPEPPDHPRPRALMMTQSLPPESSSTPLPDKLLAPREEKQGARSSAAAPPVRSEEALHQPARPAVLPGDLAPKKIGPPSTVSPVASARSGASGPLSGIDRLSSAVVEGRRAARAEEDVARRRGFQAPARSMGIGSPPPGKIDGLTASDEGDRYIPFDSDDPDLGPYLAYLKNEIRKHWHTPDGAEGIEGQIDLAFTVERDGRVSRVRIVSSSGNGLLDQGVLAAIDRAAPFDPIPEKIREKKLPLIGTFAYNQPLSQ